MFITVKRLRGIIRTSLLEAGGAHATKPQPYDGPATTTGYEQMSRLKDLDIDTEMDDELPPHLREPLYDEEDCFGPVPPNEPDPWVTSDPYVRDSSPFPTSGIRRG